MISQTLNIGLPPGAGSQSFAAEKAKLLRSLLASFKGSGQTVLLDHINMLIGRAIHDVRILESGMCWMDASVGNELSFIHLQYLSCLAFHELGHFFGNSFFVRFAAGVLGLTDKIADSHFSILADRLTGGNDALALEEQVLSAEAIAMRLRIFDSADEGDVSTPGAAVDIESRFHIYPYIRLQMDEFWRKSICRYFNFTVSTIKDIFQRQDVCIELLPFEDFRQKSGFMGFLGKCRQHLSPGEIKEIEDLHEYELFKLNLEGGFLYDTNARLRRQSRMFSLSGNDSIRIRKAILETSSSEAGSYTVFVYPDLDARCAKEDVSGPHPSIIK